LVTLKRSGIARAIVLAIALVLIVSSRGARTVAQSGPVCGLDLRMLVMSADGGEADLPAIQTALDYLGAPYDTYVATDHPGGLGPSVLANGCHGNYQGILLATDNLVHQQSDLSFAAMLTPDDAQTLATYEATFGVRQVTWYTFPTPDLGFNPTVDASGDLRNATLTPRGAQVFPYLNAGASIPIQYSWTYLTTPLDGSTTPLLTDAAGHALAAIHVSSDGRENLAMTFDSNPFVVHAMLLSYGVVNWVAKGLFVGERHAYVSPQVDDIFIDDAQWTSGTACGTDVDSTGVQQRITGVDLTAVSTWQRARRLDPRTADLRVTMAFNGLGTTNNFTLLVGQSDRLIGGVTTGAAADTLTPTAHDLQGDFWWVSHTFNHTNLDAVTPAEAASEITQNNATAVALGFTDFLSHAMVQPDVSGLANPDFLQAAFDNGLRYLVSDTSRPGQDNPSPNIGFWSAIQPGIFVIPRRANNLFFNVAAPADWAAEYNCHYNSYWGRDLSYAEVLDVESDQLLAHMLRGELDPWMFHQTNLAAYDDLHTHTLLTDLLDATLTKFYAYENLPVVSPSMEVLGARMAARTAWRTAGITATLQPGVGLVLTSPVDVIVPITGLDLPGAEQYGGQAISWVALTATVPTVAAYSVVAAPNAAAGGTLNAASGDTVTLGGSASDPNSPARPLTFAWMQTSGAAVTLTGADTLHPSFAAPAVPAGADPITLTFRLIVDNGVLNTSSAATVVVSSPIVAPVSDAGADRSVDAGAQVTLAGSASDSNQPARALNVSWTQPAGQSIALSGATTLTPTFTAPALSVGATAVTLHFTLTVDNGALSSPPTTTTVVVNPPVGAPSVTVGGAQVVDSGSTVTLTGGGTDPNAPARALAYSWSQAGSPAVTFATPALPVTTFTAPTLAPTDTALTLTFVLTANNGTLSGSASTTVVVRPPLATLAAAQTVIADGAGSQTTPPFAVGQGHLLVAFVSSDGPVDGPQATNVSGAGVTWTNVQRANLQQGASEVWTATSPSDLADATVTAAQTQTPGDPAAPQFYLSLTVLTFPDARGIGAFSSASGGSGGADVLVTPTSSGSLIYAVGNDAGVTGPRTVPDGQVVVRDVAGPAADSHWLQGRTNGVVATAGVPVELNETAAAAGPWNFAAVEIVHRGAPVVNAGLAKQVASAAAVTLSGTASDNSVPVRPLTYAWSQTSGAPVTLTGAATLTPAFGAPAVPVGSLPVTLGFALTVSNGVLSTMATTTVEVDPPIGSPNVIAGPSQVVASGSAVTLSGFASDPNLPVRPLAVGWTQPTGPAVSLTSADTLAPTFTAPVLTVGMAPVTLGFSLTASNGAAPAASASTTVEVDPPIGPPVLDAGLSYSVAGGTNVTLAAAATDPNVPVRPLSYQWTQTAGPAVTVINGANRNASFIAPAMSQGASPVTLGFQVTVGNGPFSVVATTTVTVQAPVALTNGQTVFADGASGARTTAPFPINAGDLVVAFVSAQGPNSGSQTATVSGAGLSWTLVRRINSQRGTSEIWSANAAAANAAATVTASLSSSANPASLAVLTFAGSRGIGASASASAASGAPSVSLTTTQAQSLVYAVGNDGTAAQNRTPTAGQQVVHQFLGTADSHWLQGLTAGAVSAAGTVVQMRDTAPTADRFNLDAVEILANRPAAISAVKVSAMSAAAVVSWTTDVPAASRVDYGTSPDALTLSASDPALVTAHAVPLYGLSPGATYYYRVTSVDASWTAAISPAPPAAPLTFVAVNPAGLIAALSFSEGTGTTVNDLSGTGNNGVISGATWTAAGRYGTALSFDGVSNWITINDAASLGLTTGMTIEAWVNPASLSGWQTVLYKERPAADNAGLAWSLYSSDSTAPPAVYAAIAGSSNLWTHATGTSMLTLNTWAHLAATYDGASLKLYVNGTLTRTAALPGRLTVSPGPLHIGGNAPSIPYGGQFFKGLIDEIRIYNRALTQAQIQTDMANRLP
jgi:Concanavalin A-like lectin/glucanases superfamily